MKTTRILLPLIAGFLTLTVAGTFSSCKNHRGDSSYKKGGRIDIPTQILGAEATVTFNDRRDKQRINFIDEKHAKVTVYNIGTYEATYEFHPRFDNTSGTVIVRGFVRKEIEVELGTDPDMEPIMGEETLVGDDLAGTDPVVEDPAENPGEEPGTEPAEELQTEIVVKELPFEYTIEIQATEKLEGWVSTGHLTTNDGDAEFRDVTWE